MMVARISKLPYIGKPIERSIHSHEISTKIPALEPDVQPVIVQLWVVVLSAMAGAIILLLLIYVFYKVCKIKSLNDKSFLNHFCNVLVRIFQEKSTIRRSRKATVKQKRLS